jgi:hypothetical protein
VGSTWRGLHRNSSALERRGEDAVGQKVGNTGMLMACSSITSVVLATSPTRVRYQVSNPLLLLAAAAFNPAGDV